MNNIDKTFVIGIDPSINFCGFAVHHNKNILYHSLIKPSHAIKDAHLKALHVYKTLKNNIQLISTKGPYVIVLEIPRYWGVSGFAARESGSIFKLTWLCGMIYTIAPHSTVLVEPEKWKGQQSKTVVRNRLKIDYPKLDVDALKDDVTDAIGIGKWYIDKGHLKTIGVPK